MIVRRARRGEGEGIRQLRLRALRDSPAAFGSSFGEESEYPAGRWDDLAAQSERADQGVVIIALEGSTWLGMVGAQLERDDPTLATVWGIWVEGSARRRGLGRRLMEEIFRWALGRGALRVRLSVSERAPAAAALYGELCFRPTGEQRPLRSDPAITETVLVREL